MKKIALALAAAAAVTLAIPTLASAETTIIKKVYRGAHAEMRGHHDRGWHRGPPRRDRVVVIKRGHRHHW